MCLPFRHLAPHHDSAVVGCVVRAYRHRVVAAFRVFYQGEGVVTNFELRIEVAVGRGGAYRVGVRVRFFRDEDSRAADVKASR